jgi:hypothetical protein
MCDQIIFKKGEKRQIKDMEMEFKTIQGKK